jgi:HAMP domain-containing protein
MTSKIALARSALDLALKQDGTNRLDRLKSARDNVELGIQNTVTALREEGVTWTEIAASLNVTRQSAQERYGAIRP